jgi:hypothetical protein
MVSVRAWRQVSVWVQIFVNGVLQFVDQILVDHLANNTITICVKTNEGAVDIVPFKINVIVGHGVCWFKPVSIAKPICSVMRTPFAHVIFQLFFEVLSPVSGEELGLGA